MERILLAVSIPDLVAGTSAVYLAMWFIASLALVAAVTAIYIFVLNKSPSPEFLTVAKIEASREASMETGPEALLNEAKNALSRGDITSSIEFSVKAANMMLSNVLKSSGTVPESMSISDMAYLVQTKSKSSTDISQPIYQLNLLRLKVLQGQQATTQEADWAVRTVEWLIQLASSNQIMM